MCPMPYPNQQYQPQQPPEAPEPPEPRYRFRWAIFIGIPLIITAFLWLLNGIDASFEFSELMEFQNIVNENAYVRLACLAVILIAITLIVKVSRNHSE